MWVNPYTYNRIINFVVHGLLRMIQLIIYRMVTRQILFYVKNNAIIGVWGKSFYRLYQIMKLPVQGMTAPQA